MVWVKSQIYPMDVKTSSATPKAWPRPAAAVLAARGGGAALVKDSATA